MSYFRASVLYAVESLAYRQDQFQGERVDQSVRLLRRFARTASFDYERASEIFKMHGELLRQIRGIELFRKVLALSIAEQLPKWATRAYLGRDRILGQLTDDDLACLKMADLLGDTPECVSWWAALKQVSRAKDEAAKKAKGDEAELRSLACEKRRLTKLGVGLSPKHLSIFNESAGYDIQSFRVNDGLVSELAIEVKASSVDPAIFYVTRKEWATAVNDPDGYLFHVWDRNWTLHKITVAELENHVPLDRGTGKWEKVLLRLP